MRILAILCALLAGQEGGPTELSKVEPTDTPAKLLDGRLTVRLPEGAKIEPRGPGNIMGAGAAAEQETRVVWESGRRKLVVMAYELFRTAEDEEFKRVNAEIANWAGAMELKGGLQELKAADPKLKAFVIAPARLNLDAEAVLVLGLFVVNTDRTVQYLGFYFNPAAAKDAEGCEALARKIAATVAPGDRKLPTEAGVRSLHEFEEAGKQSQIRVPEGYALTVREGPDFYIYSLRAVRPLPNPDASVNIYFGGHPDYQHEQRELKVEIKETEGKLLGKDVRWHDWSVKEGEETACWKEAILPVPDDDLLMVHVFLRAESPETLGKLRAIAESLEIVAKK